MRRSLGVHRLGSLFLLVALTTACQSTGRAAPPAAAWAEGPVRWLLLPPEKRRFHRLRDGREAVQLIEAFWRRRDPDPTEPGNPFLEIFHERVQAADRLYDTEGVRGSLTDRGRALILLGPPPVLRYGHESALSPTEPGSRARASTTRVATEEWFYPEGKLPSRLIELLERHIDRRSIELKFVEGRRRTRLVSGERALELAARALAHRPP